MQQEAQNTSMRNYIPGNKSDSILYTVVKHKKEQRFATNSLTLSYLLPGLLNTLRTLGGVF